MTEENLKKIKRSTLKLEEQLIELKKDLSEIIRKIEKQENRFFTLEEIESFHYYPPERRLKTPQEQLSCLRKYFPTLQFETEIPAKLPELAEGWLILPKFSRISRSYNRALALTLEFLTKERPNFLNGREGELGEDYLRLNDHTKEVITKLEKTTEGDFLVLPIQLGKRHLGRSSRRAKVLFDSKEFGLGPLEIAIFLLTHPEWLTNEDDLGIDCVGGEYGPYKHARFKNILCFYFLKGRLHFNDRWGGCPDERFGAATGFLPKSFKLT